MFRVGLILSGSALLAAGPALAHSPYLLPNAFDVTHRDHVTVEASFTEDMFVPEVVMKSDVYSVTLPSGAARPLTPTYMTDLAVLEAPTTEDGTYRITSGQRTGRIAKAYRANGQWTFLEPGKAPPPGVQIVDMQSITVADVYVTKGKPSAGALAPTGKGLEFKAVTHPNDILAGQAAQFDLLLDGKPLAGQTIEIEAGDSRYAAKPYKASPVSDAAGRFTVTPPHPGLYHAQIRFRVPPAAGGGPFRSLTYALTFEAAN